MSNITDVIGQVTKDITVTGEYNWSITLIVLVCSFIGLAFAFFYGWRTHQIPMNADLNRSHAGEAQPLTDGKENGAHHIPSEKIWENVNTITAAISEGANGFLYQEYQYVAAFVGCFSVLLLIILGFGNRWSDAGFTFLCFVVGAATSILCGWIGMRIAVVANSRTAASAASASRDDFGPAFVTSFRAGCVMGFALVSIALLFLYILIEFLHLYYWRAYVDQDVTERFYEAIAGYGLGGSTVALFGRVGGGIYTKAADVGADLCKIDQKMDEDSPKNPAVIADNVGDNVGDIAGMGADLFGSFAEASCAAMVISSQSPDLFSNWMVMCLPLLIGAGGIIICMITSFVATDLWVVKTQKDIEPSLKRQLQISTALMTPLIFIITWFVFPDEPFAVSNKAQVRNWHIFFCVICGLYSGLLIGTTTEYYTSHSYQPVRDVAQACNSGAATNIIYGLALGYKSTIIPTMALAVTIYVSYALAGMYGIACAALGILSTLCICLTIDAYGPICDNAGGIAEMAEMPKDVRRKTDALDTAGNTTAAIGKGFAIGSAALVSLALYGAFVTTVDLEVVDILRPFQFAGLLIGAMMPYWFSALTMRSVGEAAFSMVHEVRRQFTANPALLDPHSDAKPDYAACVAISTKASLHEMIAPGALVMCTPIIVGFVFGVEALAGLLAGQLVSGVQIAISSANSGGAWDNAKKFIEQGGLNDPTKAKGSKEHAAAVVGDTVGDPLKDTSGPSINILIKLSAIISLVIAPSFPSAGAGGYLVQLFHV